MTQQKSFLPVGLRLLVTAPSRLIVLDTPTSPDDVLRRLKKEQAVIQVTNPASFVLRLPIKDNQRCFVGWIEPCDNNGSRIVGQMQTPYLIALSRALIGLFLYVMAFVWLPSGRVWLVILFAAGGTGFLLLSQYQRLIRRDLRPYLDWFCRTLDAKPRGK